MKELIPKSWDDIEPTKAIAVAPYILNGNVEDIGSQMKILEVLLPSEVLPLYSNMKPKQVKSFLKDVEWIYSANVITPHFESFSVGGIMYHLPKKKFENVNLIEFTYATNFYKDLVGGKDPLALDKLIAVLCRPSKEKYDPNSVENDGDVREKFNPELIEKRSEAIAPLISEFKAYFLLYFLGCSDHLVKQFKPLFTGSDDKNKVDFGWLGVIYTLADAQIFGNFEQTQYTNIYTAMMYRLKKYYEFKEMEKSNR
jgi:hypothetical protein